MPRKSAEQLEDESVAMDAAADALGTSMEPVDFSDEEKTAPVPDKETLKTTGALGEAAEDTAEETDAAEETAEEDGEVTDDETEESGEEASPVDALEARLSAMEQNHQRERDGLMREIFRLRRGGSPEAAASAPQALGGQIPVTLDKEGKAWVDQQTLMNVIMPALRVDSTLTMRAFLEEQIVSAFDDQAAAEGARTELRTAYDALNALTVEEQKLLNYGDLQSIEEAVSFVESSSVGRRWRERYPHVARDAQELKTFLLANLANDPKAIKATFTRYLERRAQRKKPLPGKTREDKVSQAARTLALAKAAPPPPKPLPADRARPQAKRGRAAGPESRSTDEQRLAQLEEKPILNWSDAERTEYQQLVRRVESRKAAAGA